VAKKNDDALVLSMSTRRDPVKLATDMEATPFGQLAAQVKESVLIPLSRIRSSPFQSRAGAPEEDEEYLADLAATIEREGLLNPILVRLLESNNLVSEPEFELVAGENRVAAHKLLGRDMIAAKVLRLTDVEAARALTAENLVRKPMTDWELYLHIVMLRQAGAAAHPKELAGLLCCSRAKVMMLECFGKLPPRVQEILAQKPKLLGASQVYDLSNAGFLEKFPDAVSDAVEKVADGKIKQSGMVTYIERKIDRPLVPFRKEVKIDGPHKIRIVATADETRVVGRIDFEKLQRLIEENIGDLAVDP
jgi:ParB family chromosome partitioning protein